MNFSSLNNVYFIFTIHNYQICYSYTSNSILHTHRTQIIRIYTTTQGTKQSEINRNPSAICRCYQTICKRTIIPNPCKYNSIYFSPYYQSNLMFNTMGYLSTQKYRNLPIFWRIVFLMCLKNKCLLHLSCWMMFKLQIRSIRSFTWSGTNYFL